MRPIPLGVVVILSSIFGFTLGRLFGWKGVVASVPAAGAMAWVAAEYSKPIRW